MRPSLWLELFSRDLTFALRRLGRSPAFTIVASLSLALGIGANTAAFGVLYAVMFRPLPAVRNPEALVVVSTSYSGNASGAQYSMSYPAYQYLRDHSYGALDGLITFRDTPLNVGVGNATERITGMLVSGNYFSVLGVDLAIGSAIGPDDDRTPGAGGARGPVAVVSHQFWAQRLDRDSRVVGRPIRLNGAVFTVVGVTPPAFRGTRVGAVPDLFVPMAFAPLLRKDSGALTVPRNNWLRLMGRLRSGASLDQARAEMTVAFRQFNEELVVPVSATDPARRRARAGIIIVEPGQAGLGEMRTEVGPALFSLMGLVAVVLLLACANVTNLLVARAERYQRDTAIHVALGASRARLWSQSVMDGLVLGAGGLALGLILARWMRSLLIQLVPARQQIDLSMDRGVVGVSLLLGLLAALFLGLVTGWQRTSGSVIGALKGDDAGTRLWLRKSLIVGQLALSVVVLVAAALFGQTLRNLRQVDPGFERERVLLASTDSSSYSRDRQQAFYTRLVEEVRATPGVVAAGLTNDQPLDNHTEWNMRVRRTPGAPVETASVSVAWVSRDYFRAMGIPFLRGHDIDPRDDANAPAVAIVNETFVRQFLAGEDPIGTRVSGNGAMTWQIVGVVKDTAASGLRDVAGPMMYVALEQTGFLPRLVLHVRTAVLPASLAATVEAIVHRLGPDVPVFNVRTIDQQIDQIMGEERTFATLSSAFGVLALVLSAVGLYGIIAYAVSRRTKELGIRVALGAGQRRIVHMVVREALLLAALGVAIGLPVAYALGGTIRALLYGVGPGDGRSLVLAAAVLLAVAVASAWLPARRAARVDPLVALRSE